MTTDESSHQIYVCWGGHQFHFLWLRFREWVWRALGANAHHFFFCPSKTASLIFGFKSIQGLISWLCTLCFPPRLIQNWYPHIRQVWNCPELGIGGRKGTTDFICRTKKFTLCGYFCCALACQFRARLIDDDIDEREGANHVKFGQPEASLSHPSISQLGITGWPILAERRLASSWTSHNSFLEIQVVLF